MEARTLEFGSHNRFMKNGRSELGVAIDKARGRYDGLLSKLGECGAEVLRVRTRESDPDIFPHRYIRDGRHEFIFPPQEVEMVEDPSAGEVSGTRPYTLIREKSEASYDESKVQGRVLITYDDAGSRADFHLSELKQDSILPPEAEEAIAEAFIPFEAPVAPSSN